MDLTPQSRVQAEPTLEIHKSLTFPAMFPLSQHRLHWDGAGGAEEGPCLPPWLEQEHIGVTQGSPASWGQVSPGGAQVRLGWVRGSDATPSHPCSRARKAGGEILVLSSELELVLQRGRNNVCSQSQSSPFLIPFPTVPQPTVP